jgi:DNA-binding transcriptional LysR family regulator
VISLGLRYFLEVARCGSIAGAAAAQHVAASAVSRQIAKLEDELGVALFERQARGARPGASWRPTPAPPRWRPSASPLASASAARWAT